MVWRNVKELADNSLAVTTLPKSIEDSSLIPYDGHSENILSAVVLLTSKVCDRTFSESDQVILAKLFTPTSEVTVAVDKNILVR